MSKGAKKGENRFKASQKAKIAARVQRIEDVVVPAMKTYLDLVHFNNKTKFQELCANTFNKDLPVNMSGISRRTIANAPYWEKLGTIYYSHYEDDGNVSLKDVKNKALTSFSEIKKAEKLEQEIANLTAQNGALIKAIGEAKLSPKLIQNGKGSENLQIDIDHLICVIDFLIKASDGIVEIDKTQKTITNLADDLHGKLSSIFANTYFKHVGDENE